MNRTGLFLFIAVVILAVAAYWYYTNKMVKAPEGEATTTEAPADASAVPADGTAPVDPAAAPADGSAPADPAAAPADPAAAPADPAAPATPPAQ